MPSPKTNTGQEALKELNDEHLYLLESFLKDVPVSPKACRHYERITALYLTFVQSDGVALQDCKRNTVTGFLRHQYGDLAASTMRNYLSVLTSFYDWLRGEDEDKYLRNPALIARHGIKNQIKGSKASTKPLNFFRGEDFDKLLHARKKDVAIRPNTEREIERDITILHIFFGAGLRREELHMLNLNNFDPKAGIFRFIGKGSKERTPALLIESQEVLQHYTSNIRPLFFPDDDEQAIFLTYNAKTSVCKRMTYEQIGYMIRKVVKASNLFLHGDAGSHIFRRSHGTHLVRQGIPLEDVQSQFDHANISTTEKHYLKRVEGERANKIRDKVGIIKPSAKLATK